MKSDDEDCQSESENMDLMFRRFEKFLRHTKQTPMLQKQSKEISTFTPTCFYHGKKDHINLEFM